MRLLALACLFLAACDSEPLHPAPGDYSVDLSEASSALQEITRASMGRVGGFDENDAGPIHILDASPEIPWRIDGEVPSSWYSKDEAEIVTIWLDPAETNAPKVMDRFLGWAADRL